ncbi:MAG TPA: PD-(D/E)XK nuclease family protein, partial [Dissulfurispiraceae bacterium]|nr:PD-(D/E)XK nuclease family protein [Dissulfurispiraceae bacterium]
MNKPKVTIRLFSPGAGDATSLLFEDALRHVSPPDFSGILYIAPGQEKVREAERLFAGLRDSCFIPPEIVTLHHYAKRVYALTGQGKVIRRRLVPLLIAGVASYGIGKAAITAEFIASMKQFHPALGVSGGRALFGGVMADLNIPESLAKATMECFGVYEAYQSLLAENGLVDEDDVLGACGDLVAVLPRRPVVIIDGLYDPSVLEAEVLRAITLHADHSYVAVADGMWEAARRDRWIESLRQQASCNVIQTGDTGGRSPKRPAYRRYGDREAEIEGMARMIKSGHVAGTGRHLGNIVVAFPDLTMYAAPAERIFRRYGIPCVVCRGRSLSHTEAVGTLLSLLDAVAGDFPRLTFSRVLSSPHFSKIPAGLRRWISTLAHQSGIVLGREAWEDAVAASGDIAGRAGPWDADSLKDEMAQVFRKIEPLVRIREGAAGTDPAATILKVCSGLGFPGPPEDAADIDETVKELMEEFSFISRISSRRSSLADCAEALKYLASASIVETEAEGVRIMSLRDAFGLAPDYLYIGGLTEREFPRRDEMDYLLPESVKKKAGFPSFEHTLALQQHLFLHVLSSGRHVHLSYPAADGEEVFLPSPLLFGGEEIPEGITGIFSMEEYLVRKGREPLVPKIVEISVPASVSGGKGELRVTDIDAYRSCPRRFFIERRLHLEPMDIREYEIEERTLGTIIHAFMERLVREPVTDLPSLEERAVTVADEILRDRRMNPYWKELVRDTFLEILPDIYEKEREIRQGDYRSTDVEVTVSGEPVPGVPVKGKIDRFDRIGGGVQIIDYKTGTADLNCAQALEGNENLQLFLYAALLESRGERVDKVGIYS